MELYILRHAIAVEHGTAGYEDDSQRPLTGKGAAKMQKIAAGMLALDLSFDVIFSSPFVRAEQTARIVAKAFHAEKKLAFTDYLEVGGDPEKLINLINKNHGPDDRVMLVGHEPYLSSLITMLVAGDESLHVTMKKGGLCKLRVSTLQYAQCATLDWLLAPCHLVRMR